jgi:hypothetical protein
MDTHPARIARIAADHAAAEQTRHTAAAQLAADILTTAVESGYPWFLYQTIERDADLNVTRAVVTIDEDCEGEPEEDALTIEVSPATISKALRAMIGQDHRMAGSALAKLARLAILDPEECDFDVCDADCILQLATLGQVVYG